MARSQFSKGRNLIKVLSIEIPAGDLPTEFRIFKAGLNKTENGDALFDKEAAAAVMAAYQLHGVDRMIDLEHLSLEDAKKSVNYDPDARGWCRLELREDGSLWAVDVTWTSDGAARLTDKRQRYISPAFTYDVETKRVKKLINVAITALPATHGTQQLMAARWQRLASNNTRKNSMTLEQLKKIAVIMGLGPEATVAEIMAAGASAFGLTDEAPAPAPEEDPAAAEMSEDEEEVAAATDEDEEDPAADEAAAEEEEEKDPKEAARAARLLLSLTGKKRFSEALEAASGWRSDSIDLQRRESQLRKDREALESNERRSLIAQLVKCGVEIPATAWANPTAKASALQPVKRLAAEPLGDLRKRVKLLSSAKGQAYAGPTAPESTIDPSGSQENIAKTVMVDGQSVGLTHGEIRACSDTGATHEAFARTKLGRQRAAARK